jgi:hypothetical protein
VVAGLTGSAAGRSVDLVARDGAAGTAWRLAPAEPLTDAGIVVLDGTPQVRFPLLPDRTVAVERLAAATRVEPLSDVDAPEWDLLVTVGGLGALTPAQAASLTTEKWFDPLLGLAGAYAVWANGHWEYLRVVLDNLHRLPTAGPDVDLLAAARERAERGRLSAATVDRLAEHAATGAVPLFRWGVPLALDLVGAVPAGGGGGRGGPLAAWRAALADVNARLTATSVWTTWTS